MNIVPAILYKSGDFRARLCEVPDGKTLKKDDMIIVYVGANSELAVCQSDSFELNEGPFDYILNMFGSNRELLPVVGRMKPEVWEAEREI